VVEGRADTRLLCGQRRGGKPLTLHVSRHTKSGDRLMALAQAWLWASGCTRAWLTTDVDRKLRAHGFYRHRGWVDCKVEDGLRWMQLFPPGGASRRNG
jgi:GNAT superfamily N-acetyltransferase